MKKLRELQVKGKIKNVIIYSNNGHLESLEFIRDLIHKAIDSNELIKECIHWNHPMRDEERTTRPGMANKTWNVLKNIMIEGNCKASSGIQVSDVFFFDDLDHTDLQKNLGKNYYKVPGYNFKASFDRLAEIYRRALKGANVDIEEISNYIVELFVTTTDEYEGIVAKEGKEGLLDGVLAFFKSKTRGTVSEDTKVPDIDRGIEMMEDAISRIKVNIGGKRKIKRSITKKKIKGYRVKSRAKKN